MDREINRVTVFGGTGFVGRRVARYLRESGATVRIVSRHRGLGEDDGIEQIAADAHDQRSAEAAVAGADGVVNAIGLYVERGTDTFHSVHVETAAKIARAARQAGIRRFVHVSGIGANTASSSPYIRSRGEGEAAVQTAFPGAVIVRPAVMFAPDDAFLTTILRLLRSQASQLQLPWPGPDGQPNESSQLARQAHAESRARHRQLLPAVTQPSKNLYLGCISPH